jgi:uncharacterized protein (TIRG00374 family)
VSRRRLLGPLRVGVSLALVVFLVSRVDLAGVGRILAVADVPLLLAALVVGHLDRILQAAKWRLLLSGAGVRIGLPAAVANTYLGNFAGQFLPSGVGGDVVRVWRLREMRLPTDEVVASILVERAFGVLALAATAGGATLLARATGVPLPPRTGSVILAISLGLLVVAAASFRLDVSRVLAWIARAGRRFSLGERLERLTDAYRRYGKRKSLLLVYLALSIAEVATMAVVVALAARALGADVDPLALGVVVPAVLFLQRLPVSINGIGVSEGAMTAFLVQLGETAETGLAVAVGLRILEVAIILPGGLLGWRRGKMAGP